MFSFTNNEKGKMVDLLYYITFRQNFQNCFMLLNKIFFNYKYGSLRQNISPDQWSLLGCW